MATEWARPPGLFERNAVDYHKRFMWEEKPGFLWWKPTHGKTYELVRTDRVLVFEKYWNSQDLVWVAKHNELLTRRALTFPVQWFIDQGVYWRPPETANRFIEPDPNELIRQGLPPFGTKGTWSRTNSDRRHPPKDDKLYYDPP